MLQMGADIARISVEELYCGEGIDAKYGFGGIVGAVAKEKLTCGVPKDYDEQT